MSNMFQASKAAPTASVGANPNIPLLLRDTANGCAPAGCDSAPPVAVGMVLRDTPQGKPVAYPFEVAAGTRAYLTVALDVDFRATDLALTSPTQVTDGPNNINGNGLEFIRVTSWTSNGIRDQNLIAETGLPGKAFDVNTQRRFGFDCAPTAARQQIVVEVENLAAVPVFIAGLLTGTCGDCNTTKR